MRTILILLLILSLGSCTFSFTEDEIVGSYAPITFERTYDTVQFMKDGVYLRRVCDKKKDLVLDMQGKYEIRNEGRKVYLHSYFMNLDRDLVLYPDLAVDTTSGAELALHYRNGRIEFCTGWLIDTNCSQKLD